VTSPVRRRSHDNEEQATYSVTVDGQVTDQSWISRRTRTTTCLGDRPAFSAEPASLPLQSPPRSGSLEPQQANTARLRPGQSSGPGSSTTPLTVRAVHRRRAALDGPSRMTRRPRRPRDRQSSTSHWTPETISYQTYQLTDGSVWMLPIYTTPTVTNATARLHGNLVHHRRRPDLHPSIHLVIRRYQSGGPILTNHI